MMSFMETDLKDLIKNEDGLSISIMLPVEPPGKGDEKNKIKFKNLLQKTEDKLLEHGLKKPEINGLLKKIKESAENPTFFRNANKSIAVFINKNNTKVFNLPYDIFENVSVGTDFFIKPLLPLLQGNGEYFILGISKDNARLFSADKSNIFEVDIAEITKRAAEEIDMIKPQKGAGAHTIAGGAGAIFFGKDSTDLDRDITNQYFRLINEGILEILNKHGYPLVLVGIEYLHSMYQGVNKYSKLQEKGVFGNVEDMDLSVIHEKSWEIVKPIFKKGMEKDSKAFRTLNGTGNASGNIDEIATKAEYGQVDSLFINPTHIFEGDCNDQLNAIAINTLKNNGKVYGVDTSEILNGLSVGAVYRY